MDDRVATALFVLGPLEVVRDGEPVRLGSAQQRRLLAALLVHANEVVSSDRLVDVLWGEESPPSATHSLQTLLSRLRATLGEDRLETRPPGYRLPVATCEVDALRFEELIRVGLGAAEQPEVALGAFDEALGLWRGSPYAEFAGEEFAATEVARLGELRARAIEERAAALLELSRPEDVIGDLEAEIAAEPFRERLRALLMLALARAGRPVESLHAYEDFRRFLADEIGVTPSPALQDLNDDIVRQHPDVSWARAATKENLPSGTVTFLFTEVAGSTRLREEYPDVMRHAMARHDKLLRDAVETHDGIIVKTTGDGFHAVFMTATGAVDAAIAAQLAFEAEEWPLPEPLRVRMGVHSGPAEVRDGDYYGTAVNRAARLMSVAHGAQIVVSLVTEELARDDLDGRVVLVDLGEHRLRDLAEPVRVFQVVHPCFEAEFPPLRSLDAYSSNLPSALTTFVGREDDVRQLLDDLDRADVVTLTGTGGVGKTRLAVQTCAEALPRFPAGVWFVDLATVRDPDQVASTVATVLGVKARPGEALAITLRDWLRERRAIVLLDNAEHVVDAVSLLLVELRQRRIAAKFIVTSREPVGIDGEQVRRVPSLDAAEAVELFVQHASTVRADIDWAAYDKDIVAISEQLDGIPLAVLLAAARTRSMLPPEILRRLGERLRLLAGNRRSARERHQTLLASVDWSYDLLTPPEQVLFNRLAVFRGGFALEAVEAICSGDGIDERQVVDLLDRLVDKSMVLTFDIGSTSRYRLLETLRQYAESKLATCGEGNEYRDRHVEYFLAFATKWGRRSFGSDERVASLRLLTERPNVNAMLDRLAEDERWPEIVTMVEALERFWSSVAPEDGRRWCLLVEPHVHRLDMPTRIVFLALGSMILRNSGFPLDARRCAQRAIAEAEAAGIDPPPEPYFALAWDARSAGDNERAVELARTGAALAVLNGDDKAGLAIRSAGILALMFVDLDAATAEWSELAEIADRLDDSTFRAGSATCRAFIALIAGDRAECEHRLAQVEELARGGVIHPQIAASVMRALLDLDERPAVAMTALRNAIEIAEHHAVSPELVANAYEATAAIWLDEGNAQRAAVLMAAAEALREAIGAGGDRLFADRREHIRTTLASTIPEPEHLALTGIGRAMSRDEVRRFALGEYDPIGEPSN